MDIRTKLLTYTDVKPNDEDAAGTKGNVVSLWMGILTNNQEFVQPNTHVFLYVLFSNLIKSFVLEQNKEINCFRNTNATSENTKIKQSTYCHRLTEREL